MTGSRGSMIIDANSQEIHVHKMDTKERIHVQSNNTMKSMIEHFVNCVLGLQSPSNRSLVGAMTVNVLSSARKSLSEKKPVTILE